MWAGCETGVVPEHGGYPAPLLLPRGEGPVGAGRAGAELWQQDGGAADGEAAAQRRNVDHQHGHQLRNTVQ